MPSAVIEVRTEHSEQMERSLIDGVYRAMEDAFHIDPNEGTIRLVVHASHRYRPDPDLEHAELHTHVSIDTFAGRSVDAKRALYRAIVDNFEQLGIPRNHVEILVRDIPRENWGIRGGTAACDL
jgi:phenylpyruvate tautomerase PptA (4-oxalocrotonate tautomerase family)